jgi:hypothetical protein
MLAVLAYLPLIFVDVSSLCRYTVNLVVFFVDKKLTGKPSSVPFSVRMFQFFCNHSIYLHAELPDRSAGSASVLPMSVKDKDSKLKEENTRLLIVNSVDAADRRPRTQMNEKHLENGNHLDTETTIT